MNYFRELRCWFLFRHVMEKLGSYGIAADGAKAVMFQCAICAKTISVSQKDLSWF